MVQQLCRTDSEPHRSIEAIPIQKVCTTCLRSGVEAKEAVSQSEWIKEIKKKKKKREQKKGN